jgi:CHAD domain-containing protein
VEWITIGDWLEDPDSASVRNAPVHEFAADALDRLRGKLKKRGRKFATLDDQHLHDVRKAAKKLRYAAEFFLPLFPGDRAQRRGLRLVAALESVQDDLGAANDWATASAIARRLGLDEQGCMDAIRASEPGDEVVATAGGTLHALLRRKRFWD